MLLDFKDKNGNWKGSLGGTTTVSYVAWKGVLKRCDPDGAFQKQRPTYAGCCVSDRFKDFQIFAEWMTSQAGYGSDSYQVDKDLLIQGNRLYDSETCVLIPRELNLFLLDGAGMRGQFKQGVSWHKLHNKFQSTIRYKGVKKHIGYFDTEDMAHCEYLKAKAAATRDWSERLINREYLVEPKVIARLRELACEIESEVRYRG